MKTLKGPAIFLAQFISDEEPFSSLKKIAAWASRLGFVGIQLPIGNPDFVDVKKAAESKGYCDELKGCLLYTSPSPRDRQKSRMPSSA